MGSRRAPARPVVLALVALLSAAAAGAHPGARSVAGDAVGGLGAALVLPPAEPVVVQVGVPAQQERSRSAAVRAGAAMDRTERALAAGDPAAAVEHFRHVVEELGAVLAQHGRAALDVRAAALRERLVEAAQAPPGASAAGSASSSGWSSSSASASAASR